MFNKNIIKKSIHPNSNDPKPVQQIYSHKKKYVQQICSHMTNYPTIIFISFTMQKYFEIASIRVQFPKYYHVAYNIISVTMCVSVNNNKRLCIHLITYYIQIKLAFRQKNANCLYPQ